MLNLSIVHRWFELVEFQHYKQHDFSSIIFVFLDRTFTFSVTDVTLKSFSDWNYRLWRKTFFSLIVLNSKRSVCVHDFTNSHISKKDSVVCLIFKSSLTLLQMQEKQNQFDENVRLIKKAKNERLNFLSDLTSCELFIERVWIKWTWVSEMQSLTLMSEQTNWSIKEENWSWTIGSFIR